MTIAKHPFPSRLSMHSRCLLFTVALYLLLTFGALFAQDQSYQVIHYFGGPPDGNTSMAGLTIDGAGNLYGTSCYGGASNPYGGIVFRLTPWNGSWLYTVLYSFGGNPNDGACPSARVVFGPDGALYGTTYAGGGTGQLCRVGPGGCGTVFRLTPPVSAVCRTISCPWNETVLYRFQSGIDGQQPTSEVSFDKTGNIYGTTMFGFSQGHCYEGLGCGIVYKLTPSKGGWTETVIYGFTGGTDGGEPFDGVILDNEGNLYGTNAVNETACGGTVFELSPTGSSWTEQTLFEFETYSETFGFCAYAGLTLDSAGNLYGSTRETHLSHYGGGTAFELAHSGANWMPSILYHFPMEIEDPTGPWRKLLIDAAGSLYGTTYQDGAYGNGSAFKLTNDNGIWKYSSFHDFCPLGYPPCPDGLWPISNLVSDVNGNLFGTTTAGGNPRCSSGCGVVFEVKSER